MARMATSVDMRDKRMVERLDDVVKEISESPNGRMTNLEAKMQHQWEAFYQKWEDKIVQLKPGSKRVYDCYARLPYSGECPG